MRLPVGLPEHHPFHRWLAACAIALLATLAGIGLSASIPWLGWVTTIDHAIYDTLFRARPAQDLKQSEIAIIAIDDQAIDDIDRNRKFGWPWPREFYGYMIQYLNKAGAKVIVFDLLFDRSSVYNPASNDDEQFADAINASKVPVVFATLSKEDGSPWPVKPEIKNRLQGSATITQDVIRTYSGQFKNHDSLALLTAKQWPGFVAPDWANSSFLMHYYGPHERNNIPATFKYIRASNMLAASLSPDQSESFGISPAMFKDKIVFIAAITAGTFEQKASPVSRKYPGVEIHATALHNLLHNQRVQLMSAGWRLTLLMLACLLASILTVLPQRMPIKIVGSLIGFSIIVAAMGMGFFKTQIVWMPPTAALLATTMASFGSLSWSYFTEVRQRQFVLKALEQYVSKDVAAELTKDPRKLSLGGQKRDMTVMFTDLANFTTLSEKLGSEKLAHLLNLYMQEMSGVILSNNGTLDKYIGDSIMSFWNAPISQVDHARRCCNAALQMLKCELNIQPRLTELAGGPVLSRIGINSGPMIVGNMGCSHKFDYTVLGDAVNLASRLEGANKLYNTRILISQTTWELVHDFFLLRKLDLLQVKGKEQPMAVYELMGVPGDQPQAKVLALEYEKALDYYQRKEFESAMQLLNQLVVDYPADGPCQTLLKRVTHFLQHPPPHDWNGVYIAKEK